MILVLDSDARVPFHNKHLKWKCASLKFIRRRETKPMLNKSFKPTCPAAIQTLPVGCSYALRKGVSRYAGLLCHSYHPRGEKLRYVRNASMGSNCGDRNTLRRRVQYQSKK